MKNFIILSILLAVAFGGCSAKEINSNVDSITSDVSSAFNSGADKANEQ